MKGYETGDIGHDTSQPLLILVFLFGILGVSQALSSFSRLIINFFELIPESLPNEQAMSLILTAIRNTLGVIIILYLINKQMIPHLSESKEEGYEPVENSGRWTVKWYLILSGMIFGGLILLQIIITLLGASPDNQSVYTQFLEDPIIQIGLVVLAVVFAPIFEELLFRRVLIPLLQNYGFNTAYTIGFSGLIFGISHTLGDITGGSLFVATLRIFLTTSIGITLGIVYVKTQNIIYPILFHALNNALTSGISLLALLGEFEPLLANMILLLLFLIYLVVIIYSVIKLVKNFSIIKDRGLGFLTSVHLLESKTKIVLLFLSITLFTVIPLIIIVLLSLGGISSSIGLGIYWTVVFLSALSFYRQWAPVPN